MEEIKDNRFSHIESDPRFNSTPKSVRKVKIDNRFKSLFTDKRFQLKYSVDKRGRPVNQTSRDNLEKYYDLSSQEDSSEECETDEGEGSVTAHHKKIPITTKNVATGSQSKTKSSNSKSNRWSVTPSVDKSKQDDNSEKLSEKKATKEISSEKNKSLFESDEIKKARMTDEIKMKLRDPNIDYARGVGAILSESSSEESSSDSESEDEEVEHEWGELDRDAELTDDATDRLAVLHMDWDRIRAADLMVLFNSFLPPEGVIHSVTIYPSQFGLERMKEEEMKGPIELVTMKPIEKEITAEKESKDGEKYHMEHLRKYQLNRLKYYYAVIKFDSLETANKVYTECDGLEYESSATKLDLRFVPEGEVFDQEPKEVCMSMPDPSKYQPRIFTNTALQQGKVELTWDETDPARQEFTKKIQKNADNIDNTDLKAYLACSSSEDEYDADKKAGDNPTDYSAKSDEENIKEEDKIAQYKFLLASLEEEEEQKKNREVDLEITWGGVGLKEKAEKLIKEKLNKPKTPFEEMLDKMKQKKKTKREEKTKFQEKKSDSENDLFSDDDIPSDVDMNDPYFMNELKEGEWKAKKKVFKPKTNEEETDEAKQKQAELELLLMDENDQNESKSHFSLKMIHEQENTSKKKKRRKQLLKKKPKEILPEKDDFQVNVVDDRFNALFTSHHFNVDPADPHFHKTKSMDAIISEKLKRRKQKEIEQEPLSAKHSKLDPELSKLVSSIKHKTNKKLVK